MALIDNLLAFWKCDEAAGSLNDSVGSRNGTLNGSVGTAAGKVGTSRSYAGTNNNNHSVADHADISGGDTDLLLGGWFYFNNVATTQVIIQKGAAGTYEYSLQLLSNSRPRFEVANAGGGSTQNVTWGANLSTGVWYRI